MNIDNVKSLRNGLPRRLVALCYEGSTCLLNPSFASVKHHDSLDEKVQYDAGGTREKSCRIVSRCPWIRRREVIRFNPRRLNADPCEWHTGHWPTISLTWRFAIAISRDAAICSRIIIFMRILIELSILHLSEDKLFICIKFCWEFYTCIDNLDSNTSYVLFSIKIRISITIAKFIKLKFFVFYINFHFLIFG